MKPRPFSPRQFWQDLLRRSRFGVTLWDRCKLAFAQLAYTLRWRAPRLTIHGTMEVSLEVRGKRLRAPLRLASDDWVVLIQVWLEPEYTWPNMEAKYIVDAGANCGLATIALAQQYPGAAIAALEPEPSNCGALRRTLAINQQAHRVFAAALTERPCVIPLRLHSLSAAHSLVFVAGQSSRSVEVPGLTMNEVMEELSWPQVDLLKIDVEGYERILFRENCSWLSKVRAIVGELHGEYDQAAVRQDLEAWGFVVEGQGRLFQAIKR